MEKKTRRSKWSLLSMSFIAMILFIAGCGGAKQQTTSNQDSGAKEPATEAVETMKIGIILSQTGSLAPLSESIKNGFDLYLEQNGGMLGGKKVELKYEDDEGNPQVGLRKYRQLVQSEKVNILVGPTSSAVAYAMRDEVEKDKIVTIVANAAGDDLSWSKNSNYMYRTSMSNWQNGHAVADYAAKNIGKTAITIAPDFPAGKEVTAAFKAAFEASGGKVLKELYPKLGTTDFATYLTEVSQTKPDVVYLFEPGSDGIRIVQQYSDFGLLGKIPVAGALEMGDILITEPTGAASEGYITGNNYSPWLENDVNKKFVEAYQQKYGKLPNSFSSFGYDSALVIDKAVSEANSLNSDDLAKVIAGISIDSPRGPITIDEKTHNPIQNFYISKNTMKDGMIIPEVIETVENLEMPEAPPAE